MITHTHIPDSLTSTTELEICREKRWKRWRYRRFVRYSYRFSILDNVSISAKAGSRGTTKRDTRNADKSPFRFARFADGGSVRGASFWQSFFYPRRPDHKRSAQRTINHCMPERNSYAVTPIEMRPLKSNRSLSRSPKSCRRVPSAAATMRAAHRRDREPAVFPCR